MHQIAVPPFRQTWTGWKTGLEESHEAEMHLGRNKPTHQYTLGTNHLGTGFAENDLRILMDKMNRSQLCVLTAKTANSSLHQLWCQQINEGILLGTGEATPGALCPVLGSPIQDTDLVKQIQCSTTKTGKGLASVERLRELDLEKSPGGSYHCL